jgi:hypothetical protein
MPTPVLLAIPLSPYTRTRSIPQLGESLFRMYPQRSMRASSSSRPLDQVCIPSVWSPRVFPNTRRRAEASPMSRRVSRGVPRPISTSGQTDTHSKNCPKVSVRYRSRLWPPSKRTSLPRRQLLIPTRMGRPFPSDATAIAVMAGFLARRREASRPAGSCVESPDGEIQDRREAPTGSTG